MIVNKCFDKLSGEGSSVFSTIVKEGSMGFAVMLVSCIASVLISVMFPFVFSLITKL